MSTPRAEPQLRSMLPRTGTTLLELCFALLLIAALTSIATPSLRHAQAVFAVRAARAELATTVAAARSAAILTGGAALVIDVVAGTAWLESNDGTVLGETHRIADRHGVRLDADRTRLVLRYDALGIGRLANAAIRVRRRDVSATIVVSAYGRVRY